MIPRIKNRTTLRHHFPCTNAHLLEAAQVAQVLQLRRGNDRFHALERLHVVKFIVNISFIKFK
jgi:hypothetical protein